MLFIRNRITLRTLFVNAVGSTVSVGFTIFLVRVEYGQAEMTQAETDLTNRVGVWASNPQDGLAAALARLGQAFFARSA